MSVWGQITTMKWSLNLGRIAGIKIYIHWTFLILLLWIVFSQMQQGKSWEQTLAAALFMVLIFGCVILHELGHALMARRYKIPTRDITLLPIGGLARLERIPEDPKQELWVALAGPAVNIVLAAILGLAIFMWNPQMLDLQAVDWQSLSLQSFVINLLLVNLVLAVFNLIPAFPMDGGRVLRALLAFQFSRLQATRMAAALGQFIAIMFAFIGLLYNPVLLLIAIFVYLGAQFEMNQVENKSILGHYQVKDVMMRQYHSLHTNDTLLQAVKLLLDSQEKDFVVVKEDQVVGLLSTHQIIQGLKHQQGEHPVSNIMNKDFRGLDPEEPLDKVFEEFQMKKISVLPVIKGHKLLGILNTENVLEFIMVRNAMTQPSPGQFGQPLKVKEIQAS